MKTKLQWEPGPDIRVLDAKLRHGRWIVKADASVEARCPECGISSQRRHSAYVRRLQDLPVQGTAVELQARMTRWRCDNRLCERKTFVGRPDQVCTSRARETRRVADLARSMGYVVGRRAAERLMHQLGLPQGDDRILRNLKRHAVSSEKPPRVVGIDDWSWLKGSRYGTIVVDLERHEVVDVIGDRSAGTMAAWLRTIRRSRLSAAIGAVCTLRL